jgi:hypothetical protein
MDHNHIRSEAQERMHQDLLNKLNSVIEKCPVTIELKFINSNGTKEML